MRSGGGSTWVLSYPERRRHPMLQSMISLQVFYEGNVQGVGFRWSIRHIATGFDVTGWGRNLDDGRVELQVAGEDTEVFSFLDAIKTSELASHIRRQQETRLETRPDTRGF